MRFLSVAAACLILPAGFAQSPLPAVPPSPAGNGADQAPPQRPMPMQEAMTQNSRVRAFNVGPDGRVRSVYLTNGSVVDLSSSFGPGFDSMIHKGTRVRVIGSHAVVGGQSMIFAQQLTIGQQSFTAQPNPEPGEQAGMARPLRGGPGVAPPPGARSGGRRGPGGEIARAGVPPRPPAGPEGPGVPPPPPPPPFGGPKGPGQPPARVDGPGQPPPPASSGLTAPGSDHGAPPVPDAQRMAPDGLSQAPAPGEPRQPVPAEASAPKQ